MLYFNYYTPDYKHSRLVHLDRLADKYRQEQENPSCDYLGVASVLNLCVAHGPNLCLYKNALNVMFHTHSASFQIFGQ